MKHKPRKDACTNVIDRGPYRKKTVRQIMDIDPEYASEQMRTVGPTVTDRIHHKWFLEAAAHDLFHIHGPGSAEDILQGLTAEDFGLASDLVIPNEEDQGAGIRQGVDLRVVSGEVQQAGDERGPLVFDPVRSFRRD